MSQNKKDNEWIHCNSCNRVTDHQTIHQYKNSEHSQELRDEYGRVYAVIDGFKTWYLLECMGCKTVFLREVEYFSEWGDQGEGGIKTDDFPIRNTGSRPKPTWYDQFTNVNELRGHFISTAYQQAYELIDSKKNIAAILTCRALLETIAIEQCGDRNSFRKKLEGLKEKEFISTSQVEFLDMAIYDAGSATMHRSYNPPIKVIYAVLDVIEKLIHTIYLEPEILKDFQTKIPKRVP